jgi:hypothetical protein
MSTVFSDFSVKMAGTFFLECKIELNLAFFTPVDNHLKLNVILRQCCYVIKIVDLRFTSRNTLGGQAVLYIATQNCRSAMTPQCC